MMHLNRIKLESESFLRHDCYPFNLDIFKNGLELPFSRPVTFFAGENGTGKSTLLEGIALRSGIKIWKGVNRRRFEHNPYEDRLYQALTVDWVNGPVPGSFFASQIFQHFARLLDDWAASDPGILDYFGGRSLLTQSHGQSLMSFFRSRYQIRGLYLLDEPETALSPGSQIELLRLLVAASQAGHAQFIVATHSPILLACPDAEIYSFDRKPVSVIAYEDSEYYNVYRDFLLDREKYLKPEMPSKSIETEI
jgi:predicted ATPase